MELVEKIHAILSKSSNQISAAKLSLVSQAKPKTNNITEWSLKFFMIERHRKSFSFYDALNLEYVLKMRLTAREEAVGCVIFCG